MHIYEFDLFRLMFFHTVETLLPFKTATFSLLMLYVKMFLDHLFLYREKSTTVKVLLILLFSVVKALSHSKLFNKTYFNYSNIYHAITK